jgi:16S rRNA (guanine527-N7)-methyltransferase
MQIHLLKETLTQLAFPLPLAAPKLLLDYIALLQKWTRAYNLISNDNTDVILTDHILDSLSIVPYVTGERILDFGTGAGLPGIPLAIALPEKQFTLLDSIGKKTRFVTQAVAELQLQNVQVVETRIENWQTTQQFDCIVTRAVTSIAETITKTQPFLKPSGQLLMMQGIYRPEKIENISWSVQHIPLQIPGLQKQRHLLILKR